MQQTKNTLFRESALNRFNSPDDPPITLKLIQPHSWMWLMIMLCALLSILTWGIWGKITMTVPCSGIILPLAHIKSAEKMVEDSVHDQKSRVSMLKNILDAKRLMYQKHYLTVTDLQRAEEEYIAAKQDLLKGAKNIFAEIRPGIHKELYALVFIKNSEGKRVRVGMNAFVLPRTLSAYEYGYIKGKVVSISSFPVSRELAYSYLGNMSLIDEYFYGGAPFLAKIRLEEDVTNISGLAWTTRRGAGFAIDAGTMVTAMVVSRTGTPLQFLTESV